MTHASQFTLVRVRPLALGPLYQTYDGRLVPFVTTDSSLSFQSFPCLRHRSLLSLLPPLSVFLETRPIQSPRTFLHFLIQKSCSLFGSKLSHRLVPSPYVYYGVGTFWPSVLKKTFYTMGHKCLDRQPLCHSVPTYTVGHTPIAASSQV